MMGSILIVDDDGDFSRFVQEALETHGHQVECVGDVASGLERLSKPDLSVVLLDNRLPGMSGLEALTEFRKRGIAIPVIMMTSQGTPDTEIRAWREGAFDYVLKGLDVDVLVDELEPRIRHAHQFLGRRLPVTIPGHGHGAATDVPQLLGNSEPMRRVYRQIAQAAPSDLPVLIQGETGTGKELVSRAIHDYSRRAERPFVAINVAALTETLLESELFGHEKGVYTGADRIRKGYFEHADSGTLFLDEIGEMPLELQATLLRVLDTQVVRRIGSDTPIKVDVRLVFATNRDLDAAVEAGTFREDLKFRLNPFPIQLPPLRERGGDLRVLGRHFIALAALKANRPIPIMHPRSIEAVRAYSWPGNIRELKGVLGRAVLRCRGLEILPEDLDLPAERDGAGDATTDFLSTVERGWQSGQPALHESLHETLDCELIRFAMEQTGGNQTLVAERLGLSRNTVRKLVQKYGLE
jgi:two-component system, NtrC family, response regulator HydG